MFLEQIWPHLPTPLVYSIVLIETLIILLYTSDYFAISLAFIGSLTVSFILGSITISRPFHLERIAVIVTLAFFNVVFLAQHMQTIYNVLHLHTAEDMFVARVVYGVVWFVLVTISILAYFRNAGQPVSRAWPVLFMVTMIAIVIPLEPDAFVANQPAWLWILRVVSALIIFHLVTLGDTAAVVEGLYYDRVSRSVHNSKRAAGGAALADPDVNEADLPLARTLIWLPITLWVLFVPKAFVILVVIVIALLTRSVYERYGRATRAHQHFLSTQNVLAKTSHLVGLDTILTAIYDIENRVIGIASEQTKVEHKRWLKEQEQQQQQQQQTIRSERRGKYALSDQEDDSDNDNDSYTTTIDMIDDPKHRDMYAAAAAHSKASSGSSSSRKRKHKNATPNW